MHHRLLRRLALVVFAAILGYSLYFTWQGWEATADALRGFPWLWLPGILALVSLNFVIREVKWDLFRRWAGIGVPRLGSALVFYSGLSMTISPGRVGELIKPFMLRHHFGVRFLRGVPLVFCERLTDLFGMNLLTLIAFGPFALRVARRGDEPSVAVQIGLAAVTLFFVFQLAFMVAAVALIRRRRIVARLLLWPRHRRLRRPLRALLRLYFDCYDLLTLPRLGLGTLIAAVSWSFEVVAMWVICLGLGLATPESPLSVSAPGLTLWDAAFIFCVASIAGGLSGLPGGLGGAEGVMDQLLKMTLISAHTLGTLWAGLPPVAAKAAAVGSIAASIAILRAFTLFYAVVLGFLFLALTARIFHRRIDWEALEEARG